MTELKSDLNILELVGEIIAFQVHVGVITFEAHKTRIGVHFILIEINHIPRTFLIRNDFSLFIVFLVALDIVGYKATQFRGYVPINVAKSQQGNATCQWCQLLLFAAWLKCNMHLNTFGLQMGRVGNTVYYYVYLF